MGTSFNHMEFLSLIALILNIYNARDVSNIIQIWTGPEFNMEKYGTAKTYYIDRGRRPRSI